MYVQNATNNYVSKYEKIHYTRKIIRKKYGIKLHKWIKINIDNIMIQTL